MTDQRINVQTSFSIDFLRELEFHLTEAFLNSEDDVLKYFWCDGIFEPLINVEFTARNVTSINKITTWTVIGKIGTTKQDAYIMTIKLGRRARRRALKGADLKDCLPDDDSLDWIDIDVLNRMITLLLN